MMQIRHASDRGRADHGWLDTRHTFSFADYYDPKHMGFRALRVINDDRVAGGRGFGTHPHRDMEIVSYVLSGALAHRDSMGNGSEIRPGDVQRMTAGTGVTHSEFNPSPDEVVRFLQIWIVPDRKNLEPGYEQAHFSDEERRGKLRLVASRDGREGSVSVHQDVSIYAGLFDAGERTRHTLAGGRHAWVQIARGRARINGKELFEGDGASLSDEAGVDVEGLDNAEVLVFDLG
jgi:redox-sensitive bicupin YhaK (pirin superfamily)